MHKKFVEDTIPTNPLISAIEEIKKNHTLETMSAEAIVAAQNIKHKIVDIITFCDGSLYLDLLNPDNDLNLYLAQRVILKCFYMGTIGNENLNLTQAEWEWLYSKENDEEKDGVTYEKNIKDVIQKMLKRARDPNMPYFKELQLVLGRRGTKTLQASIITAYEAYKLLVINNGDPHGYYKLPADDEIAIINVALSQGQAGRLFGQIQSRLRNSPFFNGRIAKETASEIRLFTDKDLAKKRKGANIAVNGSIILLCGHSNPDSLAGYSTILLLFDEIAFYDETGVITGKYFYNRLKPSLSKFFKYKAARIVQISSPKSKSGIFYETWVEAKTDDSILSFQFPTWDVNPDVGYDEPELARDRKSNPEMFATEYGAQWSEGGTYHKYFPPDLITRCIRTDLSAHTRPMPGMNYYMHVDPAKKGNNYAAILVGKQRYTNNRGQKRIRCILAGIWIWRPLPGIGVQFNQVDKDVIKICSIFHPLMVTYDDYHSMQSLQLLRSHGINTHCLSYNRSVKSKLYQNLRDIMAYEPEPELQLYDNGGDSSLLIAELTNLTLKQNMRGYAIIPDKSADVKTDDLCVHPDTIVYGDIPVKIKDINIGDNILTCDGTYKKVTGKLEHSKINKITEIQPYYGLPLVATSNHPIECLDKNLQRCWKSIEDISDGDMVIRSFPIEQFSFCYDLKEYIADDVNKHHDIKNFEVGNKIRLRNPNSKWHNRYVYSDENFAYLCGNFLAEGNIADHGIALASHIDEIKIHNRLTTTIENVFGFKDSGFIKQADSLGAQTNINSVIVKKLFEDLFLGKKAHEKIIPTKIMLAPLDFQKEFICGYWDGDGFNDSKRIGFTTSSECLALQIQQILLRLNIVSSIKMTKRDGKFCMFRNKQYVQRNLYNVFITDSLSFNVLSNILKIGIYKKQSKFHKCHYKLFMVEGYVACDIFSIKDGSATSVVNLSVEGNHSYVSGCINSHNCDCLAGACASANEGIRMGLPAPVTVRAYW